MTQHTPGPWEFGGLTKSGLRMFISGAGWRCFAKVLIKHPHDPAAEVEGMANARLIATAPEMLEQLQYVVAFLNKHNIKADKGQPLPIEITVSSIIAKATGASQENKQAA